jgi:inhibitor of cysteine peptidase
MSRVSITTLVWTGLTAVLVACSDQSTPTSADDLLVEPIQVEEVDVLILESFPPQAVAHVRGILGDGCSEFHSLEQERSGNTVTVTILRERPRDAICIQIGKLYEDRIPLEGQYPPGQYVLHVNDVVTRFRTE